MGIDGGQEKRTGWQGLQAKGGNGRPTLQEQGGRPETAPAAPREGRSWQPKMRQPDRAAAMVIKGVASERGGEKGRQRNEDRQLTAKV